jgi:hypothetical protein
MYNKHYRQETASEPCANPGSRTRTNNANQPTTTSVGAKLARDSASPTTINAAGAPQTHSTTGPNNACQLPAIPVGAGLPAIAPAQPTSAENYPPPLNLRRPLGRSCSPGSDSITPNRARSSGAGSVRHYVRAFLFLKHGICPNQLPVGASMLAKNSKQPPRSLNAQAPATKPIPTSIMPDV